MSTTKIEWADAVWNPITGCTKVSEGCRNCYAEVIAKRFWGNRKFTDIRYHMERLNDPYYWQKPKRIFINSMSDLFHPEIDFEFVSDILRVIGRNRQHTFMLLTKRPERMLEYINYRNHIATIKNYTGYYPNLWLGVSVENQEAADTRIPLLLRVPAAVRFVSCEPLLGPVDLGLSTATCKCCERWPSRWIKLNKTVKPDFVDERQRIGGYIAIPGIYRAESNQHGALSVKTQSGLLGVKPNEFECLPGLDWVIAGGESGPHARPMHPDWVRNLRDQCQTASVPFFFKQWGEWVLKDSCYTGISAFGVLSSNGDWLPDTTGWNGRSYDPDTQEAYMVRIGKKNAGRELDGRTWDQYPEICQEEI